MTSLEGEGASAIEKLNGKKLKFWKFKLDVMMAFVDL